MVLPASGALTLAQIEDEFGMARGSLFPNAFYGKGGAPSSGSLRIPNDFWGRSNWNGPYKVGESSVGESTASLSINWPTHQTNDVGILVIRSSNEAIATPTGCTLIAMGTGVGTAAAVGSIRVGIFWIRASSAAMAAIAVADSGNNTHAKMYVYRGCITTGSPVEGVSARASNGTASTAISIANASSTAGTLRTAICVVANNRDSIAATNYSGWANTSLTDVVEIDEDGSSQGNGGSIAIAEGKRATSGAIGTFTATMATSQIYEGFSFALIGAAGVSSGPTFSLAPGTYSYNDDDFNGYTAMSITASQSVTWTWTRTAGVANGNSVSPASGSAGTTYQQTTSERYVSISDEYVDNSQTVSVTATWSGGSASWTITTQAYAVSTGGGIGGVSTIFQ